MGLRKGGKAIEVTIETLGDSHSSFIHLKTPFILSLRCVSSSLCPSPLASSIFPSLILKVCGHSRRRRSLVAVSLPAVMQLNDNRVSQHRAQSHPSNLQLNSASASLSPKPPVTHLDAGRQSDRLFEHTHPLHPLRQIGKLPSNFCHPSLFLILSLPPSISPFLFRSPSLYLVLLCSTLGNTLSF